jgi:hypothetical protein
LDFESREGHPSLATNDQAALFLSSWREKFLNARRSKQLTAIDSEASPETGGTGRII